MDNSRAKNSIFNVFSGVLGQVINTILSFINRSIFLGILGITYASLNGLFINVLSVLSLAELGVGEAIIFSLYKPIAERDENKIKSLMALYKKAYIGIAIAIGVVGLSITPIVVSLVNKDDRVDNLILIYILFLANSVISYFYAYKKSIILANQQGYINNIYTIGFNLLKAILQIIILVTTKSFILYLIIQIICTFLQNLSISRKADIMYRYINEKAEELDKKEKKDIFINIKSLTIYKVCGILLNSIDNIVITKFVSLNWVGYVSNYNLIITSVNMILSSIFSGLTASVGNLIATESNERKYFMFKVINLINFWLFAFSSIAILILSDSFINIWIGSEYIINYNILFILAFNFYLVGMQNSIWIFRGATGMFKETKFIILITATLNLFLSILLSKNYGVFGVFISTTIARILTNVWYEPYILFKNYFKVDSLKYFVSFILKMILYMGAYIVTLNLVNLIQFNIILDFIVSCLIVLIIPNIIFLIVYIKSDEMRYLIDKLLIKHRN